MKLILISGAEATCKSAIGQELEKRLGYTYQSKDAIKEALFDKKPFSTWDFKVYERQAKDLFFHDIESTIRRHENTIIESNFIGEDKTQLEKLITKDVELIEVHCHTKGYVSFKRFVKRNESKKRHPGHHDRRWYPKVLFQTTMHILHVDIGAHKPVGLSKQVISFDTTKYPNVDFDALIDSIRT